MEHYFSLLVLIDNKYQSTTAVEFQNGQLDRIPLYPCYSLCSSHLWSLREPPNKVPMPLPLSQAPVKSLTIHVFLHDYAEKVYMIQGYL